MMDKNFFKTPTFIDGDFDREMLANDAVEMTKP